MVHPTNVLVTGGAGFIGTHTCLSLLNEGHEVVVVDDYSNSSPRALDRVEKLAGHPLTRYECDVRDRNGLSKIFERHPIDAVVHFAAKKAVRESTHIPLDYYDINLGGVTSVLQVMIAHGVHKMVFSSSCSIYGAATRLPIAEESPVAPTNPYARSKLMSEQILADACCRYSKLTVIALRYFNPAGAHPSGLLGEDPVGTPNNVMPYLMQVAIGRLPELSVFGSDYDTPDGTAIRDYIHVVDVADGHRAAVHYLPGEKGMQVFNLGTGVGTSVLELVAACEGACGSSIRYELHDRRPGDVAALVADATKVGRTWDWHPRHDLATMCRDAWNFQLNNPIGYSD